MPGGTQLTADRTSDVPEGRLEELYARHMPAATRLAYLLTGDPHEAEDLAQEAFVRCVGRFQYLRAIDAFDAYLRRTIVNLHTSWLRRRRLERAWIQREGSAEASRVSTMRDVSASEDLWRALASLPPRQRAALVLRYYEDLTEQQTAELLGCSVPAVKSLIARGGTTLRDLTRGDEA